MAVLRAFWVVVLASAASSLAQVNPAPAPASPGRTPMVPATVGPQEMVRLQFPNSDVQDVLRLYESLTGKRVIMDNLVQGKVNIFLTKDVTREEAIKIIEMNLSLNGYSLVDADKDIVEVVGQNQNPRKAAVPIISDTADIPPGNTVVTFLFRLRYTDPQDLAAFLQQYLAGATSIAAIPLPKSSSLLVTQSADSVRRIARIVEQVDVEPAEVISEFIPLYRADASKVVDMLKDILEKGGDQSRGGGGAPNAPGNIRNVRPIPNPVGGSTAQVDYDLGVTSLSEEAIVVGKIKISADVRTNRIHVITRPVNMPFIRKLIEQFDANVEFAKPVTRPLRYISAADVFPVLLQSLTEPGQEQQGGAGGTAGPQAGPTPQRVSATNPTVTNPYNAGQTSTASGSNLTVSEELSTQPVDTAPKSATIGNTKLIADVRANAIIVLGNREVVVKVAKILDEMDVKAPQVALSTVIGELTLNNDEEFGVDWFLKYRNKVVGTSINIPQTSVPIPFPSASAAASPGGSPGVGGILDPAGLVNFANALRNVGSGTNVYVAAGNYFSAIVHAMESTGRFRVISRPMVFTSNNKKAIIANGQEVPVPVNTLTNATTVTNVAAVQSSIEYKKVALQLEVVPLINSEKEVSLDILQKIDSLVPGGNVNIGGNSVPTIATRYIRTNVSAPNCATIVLGGLIQDNKQVSKNGIPYLSKLPVVGPLFRMTTKNHDRTELIILMRPEVSLTKLDLYRLRQKSENRTHFGPELEQEDCPDCPKPGDGKQLPPPDIPSAKG